MILQSQIHLAIDDGIGVVDPDVFVKSAWFDLDNLAEAARLACSHFVLKRKEQ